MNEARLRIITHPYGSFDARGKIAVALAFACAAAQQPRHFYLASDGNQTQLEVDGIGWTGNGWT